MCIVGMSSNNGRHAVAYDTHQGHALLLVEVGSAEESIEQARALAERVRAERGAPFGLDDVLAVVGKSEGDCELLDVGLSLPMELGGLAALILGLGEPDDGFDASLN